MYYIGGFSDFVLSGAYGDECASDVADSYISIIEDKMGKDPDALKSITTKIIAALDYLAVNQDILNIPKEIYGILKEKVDAIKSQMIFL
jgi:hypothetical protein